ncbi:shikimate kinase [Cellulophaga tyrosinoxydans]|uniref:Shikimate kinase n=1 Tax=Cellulophaga tyrosinoxydans TaxID=504486 RepID=A0A1W2C6D2_9FLAO|nr:shikimate kinase [Cellulophaga tyrosinoxydans]SMC80584.1 shikimate kinase [Cellulophaga tyrosinoxydans]
MKIVLVGYMGSGKSTIGRLLSKKLNINFIDLDDYIERQLEKSISTIFEEHGEIYFRKMEHNFVKELMSKKDSFILSTGGGTPCYSQNMEVINSKSTNVFYLKLSIAALVERLTLEKEHRPLIKNIETAEMPEFIGKHLFERSFYYQQATNSISCDNKTSDQVVAEIIGRLT